MSHVIVLGAGVTGITTAWFLRQAGHEVTVVDRQPGAGLETSYANGGQISVSHAEPWANPGAPWKVLKWLAREDAPLLFRLRPDLNQWLWGLSFLRECTPARTRHNIRQIVNLGMYSRATLQKLYPFSRGEPENVATIAVFLASEDSHMLTGTTIAADGGRSSYLKISAED